MAMTSNKARADLARKCLNLNTGNMYEVMADRKSAVVDLIANLFHYCDKHKIDLEGATRIARDHFQVEHDKAPKV